MGVFTLQITFVVKETKEFHKVLPSMEPFLVLDLLFHFYVIYNVTQTKDIKLGISTPNISNFNMVCQLKNVKFSSGYTFCWTFLHET
jgi:hypothetical protein